MPYKHYAAHKHGPYKKYGHGPRNRASSKKNACCNKNKGKNYGRNNHVCTKFGDKWIDTMDIIEFEKAILKELGLASASGQKSKGNRSFPTGIPKPTKEWMRFSIRRAL